MKNRWHLWPIILIAGFIFLGYRSRKNQAYANDQYLEIQQSVENQEAGHTAVPTIVPSSQGSPTPEPRVLPPVGSNAGLVLGATVLVLIIIGGVLGRRLSKKH